jgi:hypothetical protein
MLRIDFRITSKNSALATSATTSVTEGVTSNLLVPAVALPQGRVARGSTLAAPAHRNSSTCILVGPRDGRQWGVNVNDKPNYITLAWAQG